MSAESHLSQLISRPWYCRFDALGNEIADVRWLRVGSGKWYVEAGKWGIIVRLGPIHWSFHYDAEAGPDDE